MTHVCVYEATCSVVERLVVSVDVENDGGQDTSLWQVGLLFSPSTTLIVGLLNIVGCLELLCRVSVLGFYDSLCRKQDKSCTGDHASLLTVFNVLGQVQQLAGT